MVVRAGVARRRRNPSETPEEIAGLLVVVAYADEGLVELEELPAALVEAGPVHGAVAVRVSAGSEAAPVAAERIGEAELGGGRRVVDAEDLCEAAEDERDLLAVEGTEHGEVGVVLHLVHVATPEDVAV